MSDKPYTDKDWYVLGEPGILRAKVHQNPMPTNTFTFAEYIRQRLLDSLRDDKTDDEKETGDEG